MTLAQPIHVIGAGIGGLTLARCFKNRGIQSIIFEKNPSPAHHNYGISLQPWATKLLIKVLDIDESTFARRIAVDGLKGGVGQVYPSHVSGLGSGKGVPKLLRAHRGRLEGLLREELDVKWDHVLEDIETSENGHTLTFKDKRKVDCGIVVDTSGVHSQIRKSLLPDVQLNLLPYVVFRGTRRIDGATFKEIYESHFKDGNALEMKQGDTLLQISINDHVQDSEAVDISYIYSRPSHSGSEDPLHRPNRTLNQASDISEAFFAEVSKLRDLEQPLRDAFDEENVRKGRNLHWLMRDVLVQRKELVRLAKGGRGVFFIGDAAHALPILGGEGACFAIRGAIELDEFVEEGMKAGSGSIVDAEGFYGKVFGEWVEGVRLGEERLREMHFEGRSSP
ncbi:FAD/NAD(P)-binding domain-containing protein [Cadophora sp. DSE1049]|nr:FAD/NAD(P)-binding domain-containing protein [Cadophora sp. DSE1049]